MDQIYYSMLRLPVTHQVFNGVILEQRLILLVQYQLYIIFFLIFFPIYYTTYMIHLYYALQYRYRILHIQVPYLLLKVHLFSYERIGIYFGIFVVVRRYFIFFCEKKNPLRRYIGLLCIGYILSIQYFNIIQIYV